MREKNPACLVLNTAPWKEIKVKESIGTWSPEAGYCYELLENQTKSHRLAHSKI